MGIRIISLKSLMSLRIFSYMKFFSILGDKRIYQQMRGPKEKSLTLYSLHWKDVESERQREGRCQTLYGLVIIGEKLKKRANGLRKQERTWRGSANLRRVSSSKNGGELHCFSMVNWVTLVESTTISTEGKPYISESILKSLLKARSSWLSLKTKGGASAG